MSNIIKDKAKEYIGAGLSVMPIQEKKTPGVNTWTDLQKTALNIDEIEALFNKKTIRPHIKSKSSEGIKLITETPKGLAVICGAVSGNLEVIDVDCKYDLTGKLWENLKENLEDTLGDIFKELVIAETPTKGYHIYYKCSSISKNEKLANRETTLTEREEVYKSEIESGTDEDKAKTRAERDKVRVLIETRGEGGYVAAPPTDGYKFIQGEPDKIPYISVETRSILLNCSKYFNKIAPPKPEYKELNKKKPEGYEITSLEDYDNCNDVLNLLYSEGWTEVKTQGDNIILKRPGNPKFSKYSGSYNTALRCLYVFSTATEFEAEKPYSPSQIYNLLKSGGDWKKTALELGKLGYGKKTESEKNKSIKTEKTKVEVVNSVNRESSVISTPGESFSLDKIQTVSGDAILITAIGSEAQEEILNLIDLLQDTKNRVYIKEGDSEIREYKYQLKAIFNKYGAIQEESGGLTDRDKDNLLDEVVMISTKLQPIDKDIFLKEFIELDAVKELGIKAESILITVDRLASTRDKEAQSKEFNKLLSEVGKLQEKGDIEKALELLDTKVKEVKLKDKATEFSSLMIPIKENELKERQANKPKSLNSGYTIEDEPLLLPAGAISIFAAPTSHGKTTFLINLALNVATASPDKETYLFSYEEDGDSILINTLNTYVDEEISSNNRRTLKSYFSTGSTEYIKSQSKDYFNATKEKFFKELIETRKLNIHYTNYNSDTLIEHIRYLNKYANPGAIFIDYIQLLNLPEGKYKTYSRQEEIKEICIALKDVAVETGLPIILGAQFNREVVNQLRIYATKIGEAGDIERIANLIVGFWNNNFKPLATEGELNEIDDKGATTPDTLYTTILKNRGGRVGLEEILSFNGNTGKIKNSSSSGSSYFK